MADTDPENLAVSASGITPTPELTESSNLENSKPNQVNLNQPNWVLLKSQRKHLVIHTNRKP